VASGRQRGCLCLPHYCRAGSKGAQSEVSEPAARFHFQPELRWLCDEQLESRAFCLRGRILGEVGDRVPDKRDAGASTESAGGYPEQREEGGSGNAVGTVLVGGRNDAAWRRSGVAAHRFRGGWGTSVAERGEQSRLDAARLFQGLALYPLLVSGESVLSMIDAGVDWRPGRIPVGDGRWIPARWSSKGQID